MNEKNSTALKSGVWYTASNFLLGSLTFLTTPIFARLMTKEAFGSFQNYESWLHIIEIIVTFNVEASLISGRFDYAKTFDRFVFSILALGAFSCLSWFFVFRFCSEWIESWLGFGSQYVYWMFAYILFSVAIKIYQVREQYFYRYISSVVVSVGVAISTVIISLLLLYYVEDKVLARIVGQALPAIVFGGAIYLMLGYRGQQVEFSCWRYAWPLCLPYIPHLLSMTVLNSVDKIMITNFCGAEYTALYGVAYTCGRAGNTLLRSMNTAYGPWLADQIMKRDFSAIRNVSYTYINMFLFLILGILLLGPEILYILGGSAYMDAIYVLPPVMIGTVCQFLYTMFVNIEQLSKHTKGMAVASISAAFLNVILNLIFIPYFGYLAAAYTTLAGYLWLLLVHMYLVKEIQYDDAYDYKFILISVSGMLLLSVGITYMYSYTYARGIAIIIYAVASVYAVYKNWTRFKEWRGNRV